jgi:diaminopimelate epimerase
MRPEAVKMPATPMDHLPVVKMSGSGNDFILIDNRAAIIPEPRLPLFIAGICRRRLSIGADGVILIEASSRADFRWRFFNSDASPAAMCGNGARCAARFAFLEGICDRQVRFETEIGLIEALVDGPAVKVKMPEPKGLRLDLGLELASGPVVVSCLDTGVPHAVMLSENLDGLDVAGLGRELRWHPQFHPAGVNADFISVEPSGGIAIRTYERGVEGETLACGTGAVAGALVAACKLGLVSPVAVRTAGGGVLTVHFQKSDGRFHDVYQEGEARLIYRGVLNREAWE